jgi:lichenan operon transcriptional antiterminator
MNSVDIRINYGIPIRNPLLHEIDAYYSNTYQLLQDSIRESDLEYWQDLSKDELGFITLYLAGALERQKKSLNTLLVTEISRSAQSVLIQRVTFNIPEIKLESSITTHELKEFDLSQFDCILSTSTIDLNLPIPVIQIGNIISDDDLLRLKKLITPLFKTKNSPKRELD